MTRGIALLIGVVIGVLAGLASLRVPVGPVLQSVGGALLGAVAAAGAAAGVWLRRPPPGLAVSAVSVGLVEGAVTMMAVAVLAVALHGAIGWFGPGLAAYRSLVVAVAGALVGAFAITTGAGFAGKTE